MTNFKTKMGKKDKIYYISTKLDYFVNDYYYTKK